MIIKSYHYSDFVTVEFSKKSGNADVENGYPEEQTIKLCQAADTNNKGLTFNSQILSLAF